MQIVWLLGGKHRWRPALCQWIRDLRRERNSVSSARSNRFAVTGGPMSTVRAMSRTEATSEASSRVTIAHVATRAGVSPTTVSHVLSGKRVVGAATRDVVMDAIQALGYRPNHVARNLRTRQSHMVAVLVPDITNPFYAVLTRGLADGLDPAGYGTYVCNTDGQHERERRYFQDVMDRGVDGIVFASGETASGVTF